MEAVRTQHGRSAGVGLVSDIAIVVESSVRRQRVSEGDEYADRVRGLAGNSSGAQGAIDAGKEYTCTGWRGA